MNREMSVNSAILLRQNGPLAYRDSTTDRNGKTMRSRVGEIFRTLKEAKPLPKVARMAKPRPLDTRDSFAAQFEATVAKFGDRPAVVFEGRELTWSELNGLANRYAHVIRDAGLQRGDTVSVMMENRVELLAAVMALSKLGVAAAMINTSLTGRSLAHCISITASSLCLFGEERIDAIDEVREGLGLGDGTYLFVPDAGELAAPEWATDLSQLAEEASDSNLAETADVTLGDTVLNIFTSGTTGLPKAAVMSNRRLLISAGLSHLIGLRCDENDRIYLCLPLYHGTGLFLGFGAAALSGACVIVRRKFSASAFLPEIREHRANCFIYIGELCRFLVNSPEQAGDADNPLQKMMGNGLRPDIWMKFKERYGVERISEFYGSSEGNVAFVNMLNKDCTVGTTTIPHTLVKYDVDNDEIVRDATGRCIEVSEGEPGLLLGKITPDTQFEGYTSKEATESKILRSALEEGDAWFNTGDLMRKVDVGFSLGLPHYQFVDRVGDTFRWKSENVSTNEVGELILGHSQVAFCNVIGVEVPGAEGRAGLAAIVLKEGEELDVNAFSEHVAGELPAYARPVFLRILPQLDTTGTFKMVKGDLRKEGYDPQKVSDPLYVLRPGSSLYEPLDQSLARDILEGKGGY